MSINSGEVQDTSDHATRETRDPGGVDQVLPSKVNLESVATPETAGQELQPEKENQNKGDKVNKDKDDTNGKDQLEASDVVTNNLAAELDAADSSLTGHTIKGTNEHIGMSANDNDTPKSEFTAKPMLKEAQRDTVDSHDTTLVDEKADHEVLKKSIPSSSTANVRGEDNSIGATSSSPLQWFQQQNEAQPIQDAAETIVSPRREDKRVQCITPGPTQVNRAGLSQDVSLSPDLRTSTTPPPTGNSKGQYHFHPPRATPPHQVHLFNRPRSVPQHINNTAAYNPSSQEHHAQLTKLQKELSLEREKSASIRKTVEAEVTERMEKIAFTFHRETLSKLSKLEQREFKVRTKEIEYERLIRRASLFETFFADGQRFFVYKLQQEGLANATEMELNHAHELGQADGYARFKTHGAKLETKSAMLKNFEAELEFKQKYWKAQAREGLKMEVREEVRKELEEESEERANQAYNEGFSDGKYTGREEASQEAASDAEKKGFVEGYATARKSFSVMTALQKGKQLDPTDISYLIDFDHPHNPFNLGIQLGKLGLYGKEAPSDGVTGTQDAASAIEDSEFDGNDDSDGNIHGKPYSNPKGNVNWNFNRRVLGGLNDNVNEGLKGKVNSNLNEGVDGNVQAEVVVNLIDLP